MTHNEVLERIEQAARDGATRLNLSGCQLTVLPPEIGQLRVLETLDLFGNQLMALPPEIGQLAALTSLDLSQNQLMALPVEIGQLSALTDLYLSQNQLTALPPDIGQLTALAELFLPRNQLTALPPEIGQLSALIKLSLHENQLTALPPEIGQLSALTELLLADNQLTALPPEIGQLSALTELFLADNQLAALPPEIGQLSALEKLVLHGNRFVEIPIEIGQLSALRELFLGECNLTALPSEIGRLSALTDLYLHRNQLTLLPPAIGQLRVLKRLDLDGNRLTEWPTETGSLSALRELILRNNHLTTVPSNLRQNTALTELSLDGNRISRLPAELGLLESLHALELGGNPLVSPPPEIVDLGTSAILAYCRERLDDSSPQWVSKLLVVGEGSVGKTSLLKALNGEPVNLNEPTTHGIRLGTLGLAHPQEPDVTMCLNTWDFGGQEIYHATHQFFLTNRSLFVLVWNSRPGFEQGKLYYWLNTIQALAPESPVLLVATHTEDRPSDLPLAELRRRYPQIQGHWEVSCTQGDGIAALRQAIGREAAALPLMGELWPSAWQSAADVVRTCKKRYVDADDLWEMLGDAGVTGVSAQVLARWLHELGEILYFRDNPELNDTVILKPQWVSEHIAKVLDSRSVADQCGILTRGDMDELWKDLPRRVRDLFLRLMEQFDLSYRTQHDHDVSIVVERLPRDEAPYQQPWDEAIRTPNAAEVSFRYRLSTVPAGVPTWFLARSHRFSTHTHWRTGGLFADDPSAPRHLALVRAYPNDRRLELSVRGPNPHDFLALLRDGIEVTLKRFPGLEIQRLIPCPGHHGQPCRHEFDFNLLESRVKLKPTVECPVSLQDVPVAELLMGVHWSTQELTLRKLDELQRELAVLGAVEEERHRELKESTRELTALVQRSFLAMLRRAQELEESACPCVFTLAPEAGSGWGARSWRALTGTKVRVQLCCHAPGKIHPTVDGGSYVLTDAADWLKSAAPFLKGLVTALKYAAPLLGPAAGVLGYGELVEEFKHNIKLTEEFVKIMGDLPMEDDHEFGLKAQRRADVDDPTKLEGAALRGFRKLLDEQDPARTWGGLKKVLTPEGHYLWLCEEHAKEYQN